MLKTIILLACLASPAYALDTETDCHRTSVIDEIVAGRYAGWQHWSGFAKNGLIVDGYFDRSQKGQWLMTVTSITETCIVMGGRISAMMPPEGK